MAGVFVSYRREDSAGWTGRIYDRAVARLGADQVFLDVEAIAPGEDFAEVISEVLGRVDAVVVVIGPGWLETSGTAGQRRLDDPSDYVRREIATAVELGARIVPVLVDDARMPEERDLPDEIRPLARRNAVVMSDIRFDHDMERLLDALGETSDGIRVEQPPHNLPYQLTSFVGRDRELAEVADLVGSARLVTLTGPGGSGKTRLAIEFARHELDSFPDGVWFIDLATVDNPVVVGATVASTLGVSDRVGQKILDRLVDRLSVEVTLLILDNCEHVVDAAASLSSELLKRTDALVVLATSREPLGITGEYPYPVDTLDVSDAADGEAETRSGGPAVRLFVDRASAARPGVQLSQHDAGVVASICRRLDGLPLALELAAARLSILTPDELLERLDDRFGLLVGGTRDQLPRQQTLAATIDWSYQLLTDEEKVLFARLSIFSGGFTLDSAEGVCAGDGVGSDRILDMVFGLVDKSLLLADQGRAGSRLRFLETMREFAAARLAASGEEDNRRRAHAGYFRRLVVDSFEELWGVGEVAWLDRLEDEWPNIRRALAWYLDTAQTQDGLLMAGSLYRFAYRRYRDPEIRGWLERFIATDTTPSSARARALTGLGTLSQQRPFFDEAIDLYREFGPTNDLANVLNNAAVNAIATGDWERARPLVSEAIDLRDGTDPAGLSIHLGIQAGIALQADHDPDRAVELAEESLDLAQESNSPEAIIGATRDLGMTRRHAGDLEAAEAALREALKLEAHLGGRHAYIGDTQYYLSEVALDQGDVDQAVLILTEHAALVRPLMNVDDRLVIKAVGPLHLWAEVAVRQQRHATAVTLLGAQTELYKESLYAQIPTERAEAERTLSEARAGLDPESFDQACAKGTAMRPPEALDHAVHQLGSRIQPGS